MQQLCEDSSGSDCPENQDDKLHYDIDDLDSLQNAEIDNELLENHFLNKETKEEILKKQFLSKHSQVYGYFLIPSD